MKIRIVARWSPLAVAQAELVATSLQRAGAQTELVGVDTIGDVDRRHLTTIGGTGVFAVAVRQAVLDGRAEIAVHSMKDLPVAPADGLEIAAIPPRDDPRDVLVGAAVEGWSDGMRIGTGSPRRAVQLQALAAEYGVRVQIVPIRGNVDTRLGLVGDGTVDATVLAAAGLRRLGRWDGRSLDISGVPVDPLAVDDLLPAAAQGALAVECRSDAPAELRGLLATIDHARSRNEVTAERSFLATLEAGCLAPVGAFGWVDGPDLTLRVVAGRKGADSGLVRDRDQGAPDSAAEIGRRLATRLLATLGEEDA